MSDIRGAHKKCVMYEPTYSVVHLVSWGYSMFLLHVTTLKECLNQMIYFLSLPHTN